MMYRAGIIAEISVGRNSPWLNLLQIVIFEWSCFSFSDIITSKIARGENSLDSIKRNKETSF